MSDLDDEAPEPTCSGCYCCSGTGYFSGDELRAQAADRERQLAEAQNAYLRLYEQTEAFVHRTNKAEAKLRAVAALRDEHVHDGNMIDGCLTGDCNHSTLGGCSHHRGNVYIELGTKLDAILGGDK